MFRNCLITFRSLFKFEHIFYFTLVQHKRFSLKHSLVSVLEMHQMLLELTNYGKLTYEIVILMTALFSASFVDSCLMEAPLSLFLRKCHCPFGV